MDWTDITYLVIVSAIVIPVVVWLYRSMKKFRKDEEIYNNIKYKKKK